MAARVIHFGVDECYRISVLRRAGYNIEECRNLVQLRAALEAQPDADVVLVNDSDGTVPLQLISLARSRCHAPIVLFPYSGRDYRTEDVDLVVPSFTRPEEWLLDLANLIIRSRALRVYSQLLQHQSVVLRQESPAVRETSRKQRQRPGELGRLRPGSPFRGSSDSR